MGQSKKEHITESNFLEWVASTGFLFPRNSVELKRFEKLYSDTEYQLSEESVDPFAIVSGSFKPKTNIIHLHAEETKDNFRMAARNLDNLPDHILKKLKRNQDEQKSEDSGISE